MADTGFITGLTQFGVAEGFEIGNAHSLRPLMSRQVFTLSRRLLVMALLLFLAKP